MSIISRITKKDYVQEDQQSLLSPLALGVTSLIGDFSGKIRNATKLSHLFFGKEDPLTLIPLSITSSFGLITGPLSALANWKDSQVSKKIDDGRGRTLGLLKSCGGSIEGLSGFFYIPLRGVNLGMYYAASKTLKVAERTLGITAMGLGAIPSVFNAIGSVIKIHDLCVFRQKFFSRKPKKAIHLLEKQLRVSKKEKRAIQKQVLKSDKYEFSSSKKQQARMKKLEKRLKLKKERELSRVTSSEVVKLVKAGTEKKTETIFQKICAANLTNLKISSATLAICLLTVAATILAIACTGGTFAIIAAVVATIASVGWFCLDGYQVLEAFKRNESGKYDKLWMLISSVLCFVALTLAFYLSFGILPLILAGVIGLFWLSINSTCLYRLVRTPPKETLKIPLLSSQRS